MYGFCKVSSEQMGGYRQCFVTGQEIAEFPDTGWRGRFFHLLYVFARARKRNVVKNAPYRPNLFEKDVVL
jgi:hypothetical protein